MPTSYAVLDSGILLTTVQIETHTQHAKALIKQFMDRKIQMSAPALMRYELVAVVRKWVYRQMQTPDRAKQSLETLFEYPVTLYLDDTLLKRGYELATLYNRPTAYDAQYLALAERLNCEFWTADERMYNAVKDQFAMIRWLGHVTLPDDPSQS